MADEKYDETYNAGIPEEFKEQPEDVAEIEEIIYEQKGITYGKC